MPAIELEIRRRKSEPLKAVAWYLPGHDSCRWLEEIALWPVDHSTTQLIAIRDEMGTSIDGLVAIPTDANFTPRGTCIALGRLHDSFYLPIDADLAPTLSRHEIQDHFDGEYVYVWIPGRGLTAAEPGDVLSVVDLLERPSDAGVAWDWAVPGLAFTTRVVAILPNEPPSIEEVINEGRDGIGERVQDMADLPKSPNEPMSGVTGAIVRAAMIGAATPILGIGKLMSAIGKVLSAGSGRQSGARQASGYSSSGLGGVYGFDKIREFANNLIERVSQSLEAQRHKEIGRLLNMLDNDPDQGLKFAIPFGGGGGAHRGRANPAGQLGMRNVDFNLGGMGGGGAADYWDMSHDYQQRLITKYRELAARETRLGRHRRAAYIYAQLLGDLRSAASVLEQGRHFREAAVLYMDKLSDAAAAANCLERGELWHEAIEAYRELGRHEKVGDLLTHIEQHESAAEAYGAAANELKEKEDLLGAARIYEQKLKDNRLAVDTLDEGWPNSSQAKSCVETSFALRGRLAWHDEAQQRVEDLCGDATSLAKHAEVAEMLSQVFKEYPEAKVQESARKLCRDLIAYRMRDSQRAEASRLVQVLAQLDSTDKLLRRDGLRFVELRDRVQRIQHSSIDRNDGGRLKLVRRCELGLAGVWRTAVTLGEFVVAAGIMERRVVFARINDEHNVQKNLTLWPKHPVSSEAKLVLHAGHSPMSLFAIGERPLPEANIYEFNNTMAGSYVRVGTPRGLDVVWGATTGKTGHTWAIANRDDPALVCVDSRGSVISTHSLLSAVDERWDAVRIPVPMHVTGEQVVLGIGNQLFGFHNSHFEELERLPSPIVSLVGGSPYAAPIMAAAMESGVAMVRLGVDGFVRSVAHDLTRPAVLLNSGGFLVAADENAVQVMDLATLKATKSKFSISLTATHEGGTPVALLSAEQSNRFNLVTEKGIVLTYEIN